MTEIHYRNFQEKDADQVRSVALASWRETYRNIFDEQFIEDFVGKHYSREALLRTLPQIASGATFFQVAANSTGILGFCQIGNRGTGMELLRIYILPSHFGQGIGSTLLQLGEEYLRENHIPFYFCYVHDRNAIGKNFYHRQKFIHTPEKDDDDHWYMEKQV